ncbi:hypothetical protein IU450_28295 [Nocardia abscessus]|uniref:hypothetical protein n=1 Tax=Nocardia abscessus TaxID=120957 RepID=UPI001893E4BE|nr:hypothetical protein [Nocardia abscessus]MBF6339760.1 hypothetical protein [Nocardia abscessus]
MRAPTRAQVKVLKSLQNQTLFLNRMVATATERQQRTGQRPPQSWYEDFHRRAILREELTTAAHAGGVPRAWIDHVGERGARGIHWRADLYLRAPEPRDWDRILGGLDADVQRLREWTALDAAYRQINPATETGVATDFDRNLRALRTRTAGVANLLGLTAEQGQQLWGTTSDWVQAGHTTLDGVPAERLVQRWQAVAHTDSSAYALQATALAAAGITIDTAAALPDHEDLAPGISAALTLPQPLFRSAATGADIDTAISAANLTSSPDIDPLLGPAEFSDAPTVDDSSYDTAADLDLRPPEFLSPIDGIDT